MVLGVPKSMLVRLGWVALTFGAVQFLRLLNNVILTRLLEPSVFGLMSLVVAIRVGMELVSDLGVTQNIVSNPRGHEPKFYDTAWTLHATRNLALAALCFALASPFANFFGHPELAIILPVASLFFIFSGFGSTTGAVIHKQLQVGRLGMFEISAGRGHDRRASRKRSRLPQCVGGHRRNDDHVRADADPVLPLHSRNPAPVHGRPAECAGAPALRQMGLLLFDRLLFRDELRPALLCQADHAWRSWAFTGSPAISRTWSASSSRGPAASCFIRLSPLPASVPRSFARSCFVAGAPYCLVRRSASGVHGRLPTHRRVALRCALRPGRGDPADPLRRRLVRDPDFDERFDPDGSFAPAYPALSNAAKLITYLVGAPLAFHFYGFMAAVAVIAAGEIVKYVTLWGLSHKEHLRFGRDDLALTLAFEEQRFVIREILRLLGLPGQRTQFTFAHSPERSACELEAPDGRLCGDRPQRRCAARAQPEVRAVDLEAGHLFGLCVDGRKPRLATKLGAIVVTLPSDGQLSAARGAMPAMPS